MTTSDNISAIEAVEKALGRVPLEEWSIGENDHRSVFAGKHEVAFMPIHDFRVSEAKANAAYIAACNPIAVSILLAEARKAEAMEQEIAEKDAAYVRLMARALQFLEGSNPNSTSGEIRNAHLREEIRTGMAGASAKEGR